MTDPSRTADIRDSIFDHEMFDAGNIKSGYMLEAIRYVEATWAFAAADIAEELDRMESEGLVLRRTGFGGDVRQYWESTKAGKIAREMRWQQVGKRHAALSAHAASTEDLVIALVASGGNQDEREPTAGLDAEALSVYLARLGEEVCKTSLETLIARGVVRRNDEDMLGWPFRLMLTADGLRQYAQSVVPQLGLLPPATILARNQSEQLPFGDLGLDAVLADNLKYRWEEAERCTGARAWLAATALYGSILEVVLPPWLAQDVERAMGTRAAPRDRKNQARPLEDWSPAALISVAVELGHIDEGLGRYAHALRESRNLIHPDRQIRERSIPDQGTTAISKQVVQAVLATRVRKIRETDLSDRRVSEA
ncbi:hypothetical protein [Paraburkholderia nemoris]|uniref:Uncharacterized protein n=1 Tax=Paraburkholderia nemoris TaxID=2793076 RepID=A0ABN7N6B5_9BURK|nr:MULTISPECIES: hypothetical protein [Paraburkholderia]MBK3815180.1 hypothetical protein [Paraburkholderia aspalathi]CAE6713138.1 hypothetical protein R75777_01219 [Paraburkholderia nemoris]CAE6838965.1 hypothetical protein R69776_06945 [Paraburkholderia nemoris]